jgi:hypothetical protein
VASDNDMYSVFIVDNATVVCFRDVQVGPPFIMKTYPVVDLNAMRSEQQSASP